MCKLCLQDSTWPVLGLSRHIHHDTITKLIQQHPAARLFGHVTQRRNVSTKHKNAPTLELSEIVVLADESVLIKHVQFLSSGQLFMTQDARETFQMIDTRACPSHQLARTDLLFTTAAFGAEPSTHCTNTKKCKVIARYTRRIDKNWSKWQFCASRELSDRQ